MNVKASELLAWVLTQPADGIFNFNSASTCVTTQYIRSIWPSFKVYVYYDVYFVDGERYHFSAELQTLFAKLSLQKRRPGAASQAMTFGDFAKELEAAINEATP